MKTTNKRPNKGLNKRPGRRAIATSIAAVAGVVMLVLGLGLFGGESDPYRVRAVFNNASFAIPGEDVKIAGAKVGVIEATEVTTDGKAALVLRIDDPGFQDFRSDAECVIRLQSVIGEKLVECQPTQPREEGSPPAPPLKEIPEGQPGAGELLLSSEHTSTPVDTDLINGIQRLPYRQRFTILFSEFGAALSGRGEDLRKVIRGADPTLRELDRIVKILADQNRQLRDLAVDGDRVLTAWAKKRKQTADFIVQANTTAQATAERGADLQRNFEKFPDFLRQLKPTMARLGALSDEMTPVIVDLGANGSDISRFLIDLGPFARNSVPAIRTLGQTADIGGPALEVARPLIQLIAKFASKARPLSANLKSLAVNLKETDTIQRAMDLIYYTALAFNGFDRLGHYLRSALTSDCTFYSPKPLSGSPCNAKFTGGSSSAASADPSTAAAAGVTPLAKVLRSPAPKTNSTGQSPAAPDDGQDRQPAATDASRRGGSRKGREALLDYLLGSDAE